MSAAAFEPTTWFCSPELPPRRSLWGRVVEVMVAAVEEEVVLLLVVVRVREREGGDGKGGGEGGWW